MVKCHIIVTFRGCYSFRNFRVSLFWSLFYLLVKIFKMSLVSIKPVSLMSRVCHVTKLLCCINYWYIFKLIVLIQSSEALFEGQFKIESCNVGIFNTVNELVKLEHKDWFSSLFISVCLMQSHHSLWVIQNISSQSKITSSVNTMSYWFSNLAILLKYKAVQPLKGAFYDIFTYGFIDVGDNWMLSILCWW